MNSIQQVSPVVNRQVRQNLWITESGAVVGYGPMLAANGFAYCFTCGTDECQHVQQCDEDWLAGLDSVEFKSVEPGDSIPFDGRPMGGDESSEAARLGLPVEW